MPLPGFEQIACRSVSVVGAVREPPLHRIFRMPYEEVANFDALLVHLGIKDDKKRLQALLDSLTEIIKTVPPNEFNRNISKLLRELATDAKKVPLDMALLHINDTDFTGIFLNETAR